MRVIYVVQGAKAGTGPFWTALIRLAVLTAAGLALLALILIGLLIVLPLVLVGGVALLFYVRRRLRQAQSRRHPRDGVIDAEYTVVDHRHG
ncbi:hypothetical protein DC522_12605 [Microvirga sp. KLBC 81]|uniref:hypothetical protein n=1 Tax=Microvirga sp. KLBC 81 TaxID=1862707 RepID=UPI000D50FD09|nr:hypothetical protein [Microvirga sp. KLBC 81]PVE24124.1 hypothetical protein DC522_12605 [Microvirga sp. KLBC 81]